MKKEHAFIKLDFCQSHSVNLRTKTRVLFFDETCFFGIIHCTWTLRDR